MILPAGAVMDSAAENGALTSRTYRLDLANGRIAGAVDGIEAVKQAVYKILDTDRYAHFIYSGFGVERRIGPQLERFVTEALLEDDRISGVEDFRMTVAGDEAVLSFTVISSFGPLAVERREASDV
jgi:hypothetical protein